MEARDQTRWRLASVQEKGINKESTGRRLEAPSLLSVEPKFSCASDVRFQTSTLTATTSEGRRFEVRWARKANRAAAAAVVMLSVHAFASPLSSWPRLAWWVSIASLLVKLAFLTSETFQTKVPWLSKWSAHVLTQLGGLFWKFTHEMLGCNREH